MVRKFDQMTRDEATRLRKDGKSVREIALLTGVALTTLKGWFKEIGLSRLPEPATRRGIERENKKATFGRGQKDVSQKSLHLQETEKS